MMVEPAAAIQSPPVALVTGPTAGIGRAFATELARQGHDLVLVSRDESRLQTVARALEAQFGVATTVIAADLSIAADLTRVEEVVSVRRVDVLVNNAGFGIRGGFLANDVDVEQQLLELLRCAPATPERNFTPVPESTWGRFPIPCGLIPTMWSPRLCGMPVPVAS